LFRRYERAKRRACRDLRVRAVLQHCEEARVGNQHGGTRWLCFAFFHRETTQWFRYGLRYFVSHLMVFVLIFQPYRP
jgi:hypothetical protein